MKRYQDCNWVIRMWRRRHQLRVPLVAYQIWRGEKSREMDDEDDWRLTFRQCWGMAIGLSHGQMQWVYDWIEMDELFSSERDE